MINVLLFTCKQNKQKRAGLLLGYFDLIMSSHVSQDDKKTKTSFWGKLFKTSKKSEKKSEESFLRQSFLHSSFHCSKPTSLEQGDEVNFTTLDGSDLMEMHKDAGIIFVNKNHVSQMLAKEDEKHVQFVPTPMNKYYKVNTKAAPSKKNKKGEDKENIDRTRNIKPARPILRVGKSQENLTQKLVFTDSQTLNETNAKRLVNVSYYDGPEIKRTPTMQRTSTKLALFDRKNGSMPHLNVSSITKYGTLPKNAKLNRKIYNGEQQTRTGVSSQIFGDGGSQTFVVQPESCEQLNIPGEYSSQNLSHYSGQKLNEHQMRDRSRQVASHRLSLGEPIKAFNSQQFAGSSAPNSGSAWQNESTIRSDSSKANEIRTNLDLSRIQNQSQGYFLNNKKSKFLNKVLAENVNRKINLYPNKAINEIGLPITQTKRNSWNFSKNQRSRSESPHYIPLSETYSSSIPLRHDTQMKHPQQSYFPNANIPIPCSNYESQPFTKKNVHRSRSSEVIQQRCPLVPSERQNYFQNNGEYNSEQYRYISRTKKQAIVTKMYSQKRMLVNKLCKHKSKDCDEGFSSMADDECSFNCSCSSCSTRLSRKHGKYYSNADDRFFFIRTDDYESKEERHLETVIESPIRMNKPSDIIQGEKNTESNPGASWYECNDSLCKTPNKSKAVQPQDINNVENNKNIENIYENITQIINSATKQNFNSQEIKRMISTPLSKSEKLKVKSNVPRALFHSDAMKNSESITPIDHEKKAAASPLMSPLFLSDSVILLQEIFQKLSLECRELLKPSVLFNLSTDSGKHDVSKNSISSGDKYVNDLVKSLKSEEISDGEFANIIGNIAQNIFLEAKAKQVKPRLEKSLSLPDIAKTELSSPKPIQQAASFTEDSFSEICISDQKSISKSNSYRLAVKSSNVACSSQNGASDAESLVLQERNLPAGWSRTPTTISGPCSTADASNDSSHDDSTTSESGLQLLENAIRLGMGLSPIKTEESSFIKAVQEQPIYIPSPVKVAKYKSKDVLSCKGKLKLKIYHNAGMVTVHVVRAAKLSKKNSRSLLNPYVKISMVPDESKRVNWRTSVQKELKNPIFNQIFSFEILDSDLSKRLVFSVWHRDFEKKRSELIGCMSFSVQHVLDNSHKIHGWYRLLREGFGTEKHFAAHSNKNACPIKHKEKKRGKECQDA